MRLSADSIEEQVLEARDQPSSGRLSPTGDNNNSAEPSLASADGLRVVYKVKYSSEEAYTSLDVLPVLPKHGNGYQTDWLEVKQQVLDLNFKDRRQVPNHVLWIGRIAPIDFKLRLTKESDYVSALKVAKLCGHPLNVMIGNEEEEPSAAAANPLTTTLTKTVANNKSSESKSSGDSDVDSNAVRNPIESKVSGKSSPQSADPLANNLVLISREQLESIKKEITIDVTKRLINKLNECLIDLTDERPLTATAAPVPPTAEKVDTPRAQPPIGGTAKVIHRGIICDNCDQEIEGIRYKCINCLDFDLCQNCRHLSSVHDPSHRFNKIERYIRGISNRNAMDFLGPFLSGATVDPNTRDLVLALDVDLRDGSISKTDTTKRRSAEANGQSEQKPVVEQRKDKSRASAQFRGDEELTAQAPHRKVISDKKANKMAKKIEKLKLKTQLYNNWLQTSDERSTTSSKSLTTSALNQNSAITSSKALYLSGLLVADETIPDGTRMPVNTRFRKTWRVRNTGTKVWSGRTTLRFVWGHSELEPFGKLTEVQAPNLRPGEEGKVTIRFTSPNPQVLTHYQSHWRLHHREQPFGQRLVCKVTVDPSITAITTAGNAPTGAYCAAPSVKSKEPKTNSAIPAAKNGSKSLYPNPYIGATYCDFKSVAHIHQSILDSQKAISERQKVAKQSALNINKERTQRAFKSREERLSEALKEIRFKLDDNEAIPMKGVVKSRTTTPANTPLEVSEPKSPEPNAVANTFAPIEATEMEATVDKKANSAVQTVVEECAESDNESVDVLSLSSNDSSDEFVLVAIPSCFDLNVPFNDDKTFDQMNGCSAGVDTRSPQEDKRSDGLTDVSPIEDTVEDLIDSDEDNTLLVFSTANAEALVQPITETALDLSNDKHSEEQALTTEPEVRPKTSTNPFRENPNETENMVHVLPESIVTGALSAAAHVYNNVSRALFLRNEANHFAWVTSPPPAALPLPNMCWDRERQSNDPISRLGFRAQAADPSPAPPTAAPSTPPSTPTGNKAPVVQDNGALRQLFEMGFWDQKLNQELLEKNKFDVNNTIEELLSPGLRRTRSGGAAGAPQEAPVVSQQPRNN